MPLIWTGGDSSWQNIFPNAPLSLNIRSRGRLHELSLLLRRRTTQSTRIVRQHDTLGLHKVIVERISGLATFSHLRLQQDLLAHFCIRRVQKLEALQS